MLRLAYSAQNSMRGNRNTTNYSKPSRAQSNDLETSWAQKLRRLRKQDPALAELVEGMLDDLLDDD